jgi:hypothetical protein
MRHALVMVPRRFLSSLKEAKSLLCTTMYDYVRPNELRTGGTWENGDLDRRIHNEALHDVGKGGHRLAQDLQARFDYRTSAVLARGDGGDPLARRLSIQVNQSSVQRDQRYFHYHPRELTWGEVSNTTPTFILRNSIRALPFPFTSHRLKN